MLARLAHFNVPVLCFNSRHPNAGRLSHDFIDDGQTLIIAVENSLIDELEPKLSWDKGLRRADWRTPP